MAIKATANATAAPSFGQGERGQPMMLFVCQQQQQLKQQAQAPGAAVRVCWREKGF
jgi:hypothetical protein